MNLELFPETTPEQPQMGWVLVDDSDPEQVVYEWRSGEVGAPRCWLIRAPSGVRTRRWSWRAQLRFCGLLAAESGFVASPDEALGFIRITLELMMEGLPPNGVMEVPQ